MSLVFEVYGALCIFAFVGFLALAARAKLRPDLDEEEFDPSGIDFAELEKLKKLLSPADALSTEPRIMEEPSLSPLSRVARTLSEVAGSSSLPMSSYDPASSFSPNPGCARRSVDAGLHP
jgi:hypothetical protein